MEWALTMPSGSWLNRRIPEGKNIIICVSGHESRLVNSLLYPVDERFVLEGCKPLHLLCGTSWLLYLSVGVGAAGDSPKVIHHLCGAASLTLVIPHISSSNVSNSFQLSNVDVITQV